MWRLDVELCTSAGNINRADAGLVSIGYLRRGPADSYPGLADRSRIVDDELSSGEQI